MPIPEEMGLSGWVAAGILGSVFAILVRSNQKNFTTLDFLRREVANASQQLRQEIREHDNTVFKLQHMCAEYRYRIAQLEAENQLLRSQLSDDQDPRWSDAH